MKQNEYEIFSLPKSFANSVVSLTEMSKLFSPFITISNSLETQAAIMDSFTPLLAATQSFEPCIKYFNENAKVLMQFADNISILTKRLDLPYPHLQKASQKFAKTTLAAENSTSTIAQPLHSIDFDNLFTSMQPESINENSDDYIITDSPIIKEFDISDTIAIPIGHNRIRMKTGDFFGFLNALIATLGIVIACISNNNSTSITSNIEPPISTQEDVVLSHERDQFILDILESVDASESSQSDILEDIKESLQELVSSFQNHLGSSELNQMSPELIETSPDSVQEAGSSIQTSTDTFPSSPNTGYDNE